MPTPAWAAGPAVPATAGVKEQELRAAQEAGAADRVVQVEVVGRVR